MQIGKEVSGGWMGGRLLRTRACVSTTTSTQLPVFPVSLLLNKTEVSRADSICSTQLAWPTVNLSRSDKNYGGADETNDIVFAADNPGDWMRHCYMTDHQGSGMMAVIRVS